MALAPDPTASQLVTEAFRRVKNQVPASTIVTRGTDEWLEELKTEIWLSSTNHRLLESTSVRILQEGVQRYGWPSDYNEYLSLTVLDGPDERRGTLQSATSTTATLASTYSIIPDETIGKEILITSGTGVGQIRSFKTFNSITKLGDIDTPWVTIPNSSSKYLVVSDYVPLDIPSVVPSLDKLRNRTIRGRPEVAYVYDQEFWIVPVPDKSTYGLYLRYYINMIRLDLSSSLLTKVYREWRSLWVKGLMWKVAEAFDDERVNNFKADFSSELTLLGSKQPILDFVKYQDL